MDFLFFKSVQLNFTIGQDKEIVDIKYLANSTQGEAGIVTTFSALIMYKED